MVFGLVLTVHIMVSLILIGVVLVQGGRGGLSETIAGGMAQSLFGGQAITVFTRLTAACAAIFVVTCLTLAYLSTAQGRSVIEQVPIALPESLPGAAPAFPVPTPPLISEPASDAPATQPSVPEAPTPPSSEPPAPQ